MGRCSHFAVAEVVVAEAWLYDVRRVTVEQVMVVGA